MDYTTGVEPVTVLKSRSADLIRRTRRTRQPVVITQNGKPTAVLQDIDTYQQQRETLLLLMAITQGERDYREGRVISDAAAKRRFTRLLSRLKGG
jgi:prevent-host-death family protein